MKPGWSPFLLALLCSVGLLACVGDAPSASPSDSGGAFDAAADGGDAGTGPCTFDEPVSTFDNCAFAP